MATTEKTTLTASVQVNASVEKVWKFWTRPEHITQWNNASDDWHTPYVSNDLRPEGKFSFRMEAKDGSFGFDFEGIYNKVRTNQLIDYTISDGRKVHILFDAIGNTTNVTEHFEAEEVNSLELQQNGWQAILNNFKKYAEAH